MRHLYFAAAVELLAAALATGADRPRQAPPVVRPPQAPAVERAGPAPAGNPPGANFRWRELPGIGWGWVQDGVTTPFKATAPKVAQPVLSPAVPAGAKILTTADGRRYYYQCTGSGCVRVFLD